MYASPWLCFYTDNIPCSFKIKIKQLDLPHQKSQSLGHTNIFDIMQNHGNICILMLCHRMRKTKPSTTNKQKQIITIIKEKTKKPNQHSKNNHTLKSRPPSINETKQQMNRDTRTVTGSFQKLLYYDMRHFFLG